jgi:hypothetical protein
MMWIGRFNEAKAAIAQLEASLLAQSKAFVEFHDEWCGLCTRGMESMCPDIDAINSARDRLREAADA